MELKTKKTAFTFKPLTNHPFKSFSIMWFEKKGIKKTFPTKIPSDEIIAFKCFQETSLSTSLLSKDGNWWKILPPRWKVMMIKQEVKTAHEHIFSSFINFFHFSPPSFLTHINLTHLTHNFVARFQNFLTHCCMKRYDQMLSGM